MGRQSELAKKRLRRVQKTKKRKKGSLSFSEDDRGVDQVGPVLQETNSTSTEIRSRSHSPAKEQVATDNVRLLEKKLHYAHQDVQYFKTNLKEQERKGSIMQKDFDLRVAKVRYFWREKIYNEGTRAGKFLKISMQN